MTWVSGGKSIDFAVHAALVHTGHRGQIVLFSGDQHDPVRARRHNIQHTRLFDCAASLTLDPPPPSPGADLFCCGHALLGDGRLLVIGGTETFPQDSPPLHAHEGHFTGLKRAEIFDPVLASWTPVADMANGRWYPTLVTLPGGQMLALGGHTDAADLTEHANNRPAVFDPATGAWSQGAPHGPLDPPLYYPRVFVLPSFDIFVATPIPGEATSSRYDFIGDRWTAIPSATLPAGYGDYSSSAVLLPLTPENHYRPRVLMSGQRDAALIDLQAAAPSWQPSTRSWPGGTPPTRRHGHTVLLPTGGVFVCGGVADDSDYTVDKTDTVMPELYQPDPGGTGPGTWSRLNQPAPNVRGYHSVALLQPDGSVWVCGSQYPATKYSFHNEGGDPFDERGPDGDGLNPDGTPVRNLELAIDVFRPSYMSARRPAISVSPASVHCGDDFYVYTPDADSITRVAVLRAGSVTHAFNPDQRYVGLSFQRVTNSQLRVSAPADAAIAPAGHYLLVIVNRSGIPSEGEFLQILPGCALSHLIEGAGTAGAAALGDRLRGLRDAELVHTGLGRELAALLQRHSPELIRLVAAEPEVGSRAWALLERVEPMATSGERFGRATLDAAQDLLRDVQRLASPSLREAIGRVLLLVPRFHDRTLREGLAAAG